VSTSACSRLQKTSVGEADKGITLTGADGGGSTLRVWRRCLSGGS